MVCMRKSTQKMNNASEKIMYHNNIGFHPRAALCSMWKNRIGETSDDGTYMVNVAKPHNKKTRTEHEYYYGIIVNKTNRHQVRAVSYSIVSIFRRQPVRSVSGVVPLERRVLLLWIHDEHHTQKILMWRRL